MGLFEHWPYTNFHNLNLDWIIGKVKDIDNNVNSAASSAESAASSAESAANSSVEAAASASAAETSASGLSEAVAEMAVTNARIDNLIVDGTPTEGNTELLDIRVGYDGATYQTAGAAVRGQISEIMNDLADGVSYDEIANTDENLANGTYTANGSGTTISGNTATISTAYSGLISNEFTLENSKIKVRVTSTFNVPRLMLRLQYYTTAWQTTNSLFDLTSGSEREQIIDVSSYNASRYRILIQASAITSGVTNTITVNTLEIYDCNDFEASTYYDSNFESMMVNVFDEIDRAKEGNAYYCKKDGTGDFTSLVSAINYINNNDIMDATLYVGSGEWDIIDEFGETYMNAVSSTVSTWGLVLKNRIHLVGSSQTVVKAEYTGSNTNVKAYFSAFNAGQRGFTLENIKIVDDGIRYSVHDDLGNAGNTPYTNKYINCTMIHKNGMYGDCIGGGIGEDCYVEIRGCYFEGDSGRPRLAYYHGNNNSSVTNAMAHIIVCDNYFAQDGTFKLTNYGYSTTVSKAFVSNNSFGSAPEVNDGSSPSPIIVNMQMIAWNNEIRS